MLTGRFMLTWPFGLISWFGFRQTALGGVKESPRWQVASRLSASRRRPSHAPTNGDPIGFSQARPVGAAARVGCKWQS